MSEYSLHQLGRMIRDRVRTDAYARALEQMVRPDSVVLDLGAGSGMFALLAARSGARRVFAVESGDVIELGRELATANGLADRITFIQSLSTRIDLPEPADVIVSDLRGVLPTYTAHIPSIVDARSRHLAGAGVLVPFRETLWAAPAELSDVYEDRISSWEASPYGVALAGGRAFAANSVLRVSASADEMLASPARLATLDYRSISSPNVKASVELVATRSGSLHGVVVWFDSELADGVGFTTAPGAPETVYCQAFFPLLEPVHVMPDDVISLDFWASLIDDDYVFRWDTRVAEPSNPSIKAAFTQSTVFASPITVENLARREDGYAPTATRDGEAVAFVLERADGRRTLRDLSQEVGGRFPELFRSSEEALRFVTGVTQKYCR
jgi:protein arginine N-methyltransferase 1